MQLKPQSKLQGGKYKIEKILGQGGFGITYLATQEFLNRKVAVKEFFMREHCMRDSDTSHVTLGTANSRANVEKFLQKFIKEAQTIAGMDNRHIINIYDVFEENGTAYYVMEYLGDGDLQSRIPEGGMNEKDAIYYIRQIGDALSYIHSQNILHLDVKPTNVMVRQNGEAVLIDFGIAKHYDAKGGSQTSSTPVGVSEGYAPSEQYDREGVSSFSAATDIYSLGATFFKLVTGERPPKASIVLNEGLPDLPKKLSKSVVDAITKAMAPRRKDRPQTIGEFLSMLSTSSSTNKYAVDDDESTEIAGMDMNEEPEVTPAFEEEEPEKKGGIWGWIIAFLICIGASVAGFFLFMASNSEDIEEAPVEQSQPVTQLAPETPAPANNDGEINGHGYIDLGLSVLWATENMGAISETDCGKYMAWGEVDTTKTTFSKNNCLTYQKAFARELQGNIDYDVARKLWRGAWRLPTSQEFNELIEKCIWTKVKRDDDQVGYEVEGPNGKVIFLPLGGLKQGSFKNADSFNEVGYYWSGTHKQGRNEKEKAFALTFGMSSKAQLFEMPRYNGLCIRPVANK
ncbi:MAG: serine/threonine protein kinase [Bacteroidaceae bacterium]|nr:serine/threonine protein kinase [Bacteroidaceae bacterium]